jgi:cytochrome c oxidase subunit 2
MIALGLLAAAVGTAVVLYMDWFPEQASTAADDIDWLYDVLLIFSVPIFVLVMTVAIYSVIKFRARPGDTGDGAPIHGNTRLEIFWVTIPFLIVSGLAIYGWIVLDDIEAKQRDEMVVRVTGRQFTWDFAYPSERVRSSELVLPKDQPVHFEIVAKDVIHSFWVPEFRLKSDAVPGLTTDVRLTPDKVGEWNVVCAELCGIGHSTMRQEVRVIEQSEWDSWVEQQRRRPDRIGGER